MHDLGMNMEDEYLLPSPPAVRAGRRPPGAAQPLEWINLLFFHFCMVKRCDSHNEISTNYHDCHGGVCSIRVSRDTSAQPIKATFMIMLTGQRLSCE